MRNQGFAALQRQPRSDKGSRKALSPEACQAIVELRQQYPQLKIKVLVRQLLDKGVLQPGTFSLPSVYRLLAAHQLDARSIKHNPPPEGGPTKAFECALANELWMTGKRGEKVVWKWGCKIPHLLPGPSSSARASLRSLLLFFQSVFFPVAFCAPARIYFPQSSAFTMRGA